MTQDLDTNRQIYKQLNILHACNYLHEDTDKCVRNETPKAVCILLLKSPLDIKIGGKLYTKVRNRASIIHCRNHTISFLKCHNSYPHQFCSNSSCLHSITNYDSVHKFHQRIHLCYIYTLFAWSPCFNTNNMNLHNMIYELMSLEHCPDCYLKPLEAIFRHLHHQSNWEF